MKLKDCLLFIVLILLIGSLVRMTELDHKVNALEHQMKQSRAFDEELTAMARAYPDVKEQIRVAYDHAMECECPEHASH